MKQNGAKHTKATIMGIFWRRLTLCMLLAFVLNMAYVFIAQTRIAEAHTLDIIELNLNDIQRRLTSGRANLTEQMRYSQETAIVRCRSFAGIIKSNPSILKDVKALEETARLLGVDHVGVVDANGIVIASNRVHTVGYNMASAEQSRYFLPILKDSTLELVQELQAPGDKEAMKMQYAGVARMDAQGIVQIGYSERRLETARRLVEVRYLAGNYRIGNSGSIIICDEDGLIRSSMITSMIGQTLKDFKIEEKLYKNKEKGKFVATINSHKCLCAFMHSGHELILGVMPYREMYESRTAMFRQLVCVYVVIFIVLLFIIFFIIRRDLFHGIVEINNILKMIASGKWEKRVNVHTSLEFSILSDGINSMVDALAAAKVEVAERIEKELRFAKEIQHSSLPRVFPPFPGRTEIDIYASMRTAKEVGGDFYDFFFVDATHLAIVIADVSGKGIPAALFMMSAKTLIEDYAKDKWTPKEILAATNKRLCENNEADMFVTAFLGILDTSTGLLTFANAGHNPPVFCKSCEGSRMLQPKTGFILGGISDIEYENEFLQLEKGDALLLYTDGVTEAQNVSGLLFGTERLMNCLESRFCSSEELIITVERELIEFAGKAEQADDITMLALKFQGERNA